MSPTNLGEQIGFGSGYLVLLEDKRRPEPRRYADGMHMEVMVDDAQAEPVRLLWSVAQSTREVS